MRLPKILYKTKILIWSNTFLKKSNTLACTNNFLEYTASDIWYYYQIAPWESYFPRSNIFLIYLWQLKPFSKAIPSPVPEVLWSALPLITNPASTPLQILQNTDIYNFQLQNKRAYIKYKIQNTKHKRKYTAQCSSPSFCK